MAVFSPTGCMRIVIGQRIMGTEHGPSYVLRNKTGLAVLGGDHHIGWWVGWVEVKEEITFFAIALEAIALGEGFNPARIAIARDALNSLGVAIKR